MKSKNSFWINVPGWLVNGIMVLLTVFWTFWGINEMYHEGWWGSWLNRLPYLAPIVLFLIPTLIGFGYPFIASGLMAAIAVGAFFIFGLDDPQMGFGLLLIAGLYLWAGFLKRKVAPVPNTHPRWWRRHPWSAVTLMVVFLIILVSSINMLPILLTRYDDGDRSARRIHGNGVDLLWAPQGPGWNWQQPWGGYPSWHSIALYGLEPMGLEDKTGYGQMENGWKLATQEDMQDYNLCRYLSEDGLSLLETPLDYWRMPTTDEVVRSLVHDGENAGCTWDGELLRTSLDCQQRPDKESPLWSTEFAPIYYWTADEFDELQAYFVSYNGMVNTTRKNGGNPRHSYRCVHEP